MKDKMAAKEASKKALKDGLPKAKAEGLEYGKQLNDQAKQQ